MTRGNVIELEIQESRFFENKGLVLVAITRQGRRGNDFGYNGSFKGD